MAINRDSKSAGSTAGNTNLPDTILSILEAIEEQGRLTLDLVRVIVGQLMPKEGEREGPSLEELLAKVLAQQQQIIAIGRATQTDVQRLGETLPDAVAEAVGDQPRFQRVPRS